MPCHKSLSSSQRRKPAFEVCLSQRHETLSVLKRKSGVTTCAMMEHGKPVYPDIVPSQICEIQKRNSIRRVRHYQPLEFL